MPPRGGNPGLSDADISAMVAFIRSNSADVAVAPTAVPEVVNPNVTEVPFVLPVDLIVSGQATPPPQAPFDAEKGYQWACATCHGADGRGVEGYGSSLFDNSLLSDDTALRSFLIEGRPFADVLTEFPHPPRGGYPVLSDEQIDALINYLHTLVQ
jgi:cytochrome c5